MASRSTPVFAALEKHGLLLLTEAHLPNVCALVAGETVRGSWWAHPRAREIVSGKVTYVHRSLWPQVVAIGRAREPWQMQGLRPDARKLLAAVDRAPVEPDRRMSKTASELENNLLVYGTQFHGESGAHVRPLESWDHWSRRVGASPEKVGNRPHLAGRSRGKS